MEITILEHHSKILKRKSVPIVDFNEDLQSLVTLLMNIREELQIDALCASQLGILHQVMVVGDIESKQEPICLINAEITESEGEYISDEVSLTFPGIAFNIPRKGKINVKYQDMFGNEVTGTFTEQNAAYIQQQLDHFDGKLPIDYMSNLKKERFLKKYDEMIAEQTCHSGCGHDHSH